MTSFAKTYGPWALVTGASDGIGRAMAEDLAARGLNLLLVARRKDVLDQVAAEMRQRNGVQAIVLAADLGDPSDVARVLSETAQYEVGLFAACAGFGTAGDMLEIDLDADLNMIDVNCRSVLQMTQALAGRMATQGRGGIVLMSSIVAFQGVSGSANYAATKAYIQTLAEGIRPELRRHGVDVIASAPGPVATGFATRANMEMRGAASPAIVAKETLNALGRRGLVRPGTLAKVLGYNLAVLPRFGRRMVMGRIMSGMIKHQKA